MFPCFLWNRVMPARGKRVTTTNSGYTERQTFYRSMSFDRFFCVTRTAGQKSAILPQYGADKKRIEPDYVYEDSLHLVTLLQCVSNDCHNNSLFISPVCFCGNTTRSSPQRICWFFLKLSLTSRLNMFRVTAFRSLCLDTTRPSRE